MSDRTRLKRLANDLRARVKQVIDAADLERLLAMGAPADEYEQEVELIAGRLYNRRPPSVPAIEAIVYEVWDDRFGPIGEQQVEVYRKAIREVAESLMAEMRALGLVGS